MCEPTRSSVLKGFALATICFLVLFSCASKKVALKDAPPKAVSVTPAVAADPAPPKADSMENDLGADFEDEEMAAPPLQVADPLEPLNRVMFQVNDKLYFYVLKPVARGYRWVVPTEIRVAARNFFYNLAGPIRVANCLLQSKIDNAVAETGRFFINSTAGVLGFANVLEKKPYFNPPPEDLGQTLGHAGIGNGFYIVWPLLGPSTLRDSVGRLGDSFLSPVTYVQPYEVMSGVRAYEMVNETSFHIGDYEAFKKAAFEPYTALRDAYIQNRQKKVEE